MEVSSFADNLMVLFTPLLAIVAVGAIGNFTGPKENAALEHMVRWTMIVYAIIALGMMFAAVLSGKEECYTYFFISIAVAMAAAISKFSMILSREKVVVQNH